MTSRTRMDLAMRPASGRLPDRTPVMCQLSLGHYFLHAGGDPFDIWHDGATFAAALVAMQQRYRFDGILVNLPGRDPEWRRQVRAIEQQGGRRIVRWTCGRSTIVVPDDNPRVLGSDGRPCEVDAAAVDPDRLFYVDPHDLTGVGYPSAGTFPPWQWDTTRLVRAAVPDVSVHAEVFSPLSQWVALVGCSAAMMSLVEDASKVQACLERLTDGAATLACGHLEAGADAVLISSAYAGAGLISMRHYEKFVQPYEHALIARMRTRFAGTPVYTHTCGAIGDRLELMVATGTDGIDTLDPPPLGSVDLADARRRLPARVFIKGNVDPVNTMLRGSPEQCCEDARARIRIAGPGGYILSTACSVAPRTPPENIEALVRAAEDAA